MLVTITHNGFHGLDTFRVRSTPHICSDLDEDGSARYYIEVSREVARRLNNRVCGMADCRCGEHVARLDTAWHGQPYPYVSIFYVSADGGRTGTIKGRYPQGR